MEALAASLDQRRVQPLFFARERTRESARAGGGADEIQYTLNLHKPYVVSVRYNERVR